MLLSDNKTAAPPGQPCTIEHDIELFVRREITVPYRIAALRKLHRPVRHLVRHQQLAKAIEVAA